MKTYLINLWDGVRGSYWFVPALLAVVALVLSIVMPWVDQGFADAGFELPAWAATRSEAAQTTLSAAAGAMIGVSGTVFSITIVTLSLTSQQFGPRLLRQFMYDLLTQITLGVFLATGFYCLLILRTVEITHDPTPPHFSMLVAAIMVVTSMMLLIAFIHHVSQMIQAPHVVASVAKDLDDAIDRLFPERLGEAGGEKEGSAPPATCAESSVLPPAPHLKVLAQKEGYVQAIDAHGMMELAEESNATLRLAIRPGDFLVYQILLAEVWFHGEPADTSSFSERLNEAVIVGIRRTPRQDLECAIDELVEVAVRSLSPGINDPFTAMNCVDRLAAAVGRIAQRQLPAPYRYDQDGMLRVIVPEERFAGVLDAAFNQIRQYGRDSVAVTIRMLEAFERICPHLFRQEDAEAMLQHARMLARHADEFREQHDRDDVLRRYQRVEHAVQHLLAREQ
ncbi:MAG: hypothetical protein KatS3mg111_0428 [Pirellulaceae bacterium]|nr:MAG: hypothetical protein KatS3mg111_0428 [Pirellulaceae bacterium]